MVPLLSPAGVGEYVDYRLLGWVMSRYSGAWVGFKCQTEIVECSGSRSVAARNRHPCPAAAADGLSMRWPSGQQAMERRVEAKLAAVLAFARASHPDRQAWPSSQARLGIVSTGRRFVSRRHR